MDVAVSDDRAIEMGGRFHFSRRLSNGEYESIRSTVLTVYDLSGSTGPRLVGSLRIFGAHEIDGLVGDYILCEQYGMYYGTGGVQVFQIREDRPPRPIGFYPVPITSFTPTHYQDGYIIIPSEDDGGYVVRVEDG